MGDDIERVAGVLAANAPAYHLPAMYRRQAREVIEAIRELDRGNHDVAIKALADAKDTILALLKSGGAFDAPSTLAEIDSAIRCLEGKKAENDG